MSRERHAAFDHGIIIGNLDFSRDRFQRVLSGFHVLRETPDAMRLAA
jgi:hypothetical protein